MIYVWKLINIKFVMWIKVREYENFDILNLEDKSYSNIFVCKNKNYGLYITFIFFVIKIVVI